MQNELVFNITWSDSTVIGATADLNDLTRGYGHVVAGVNLFNVTDEKVAGYVTFRGEEAVLAATRMLERLCRSEFRANISHVRGTDDGATMLADGFRGYCADCDMFKCCAHVEHLPAIG